MVALPLPAYADGAHPGTPDRIERYTPIDKSAAALPAPGSGNVIEIKFRPTAQMSVEDGRVQASSAEAGALLKAPGVAEVQPLFQVEQPALQAMKAAAEASSATELPDLSQWAQITVAPGTDSVALAKQLNENDAVEIAYVRPDKVEPSSPESAEVGIMASNGNYESHQGYLGAPDKTYGINALYAHTIKGGDGSGVTIADVEGGWETNHPDLTKLRNATVTRGTPVLNSVFHGTAVMGEVIADKNGFGVTGIVYGANAMISHDSTRERGYNPANAITVAAENLKAGDVMMLEMQTTGCVGGGGRGHYAPMEWIPSVYDSIKVAVGKGINVIEAAGNGSENLDSSCYGTKFPRNQADSGAIIVGAGAGRTSQGQVCGNIGYRQDFSTYGSRVNSFGWGRCVTTTYSNGGYTSSFSGTSSATPIVAGAVTSLSGIAKARGVTLTPKQMRDVISATGTKAVDRQGIGTMPDLKKAVAELDKIGKTD